MHSNFDTAHAEQIRELAGSDRKIVFVSGNFNIVHPGHLRLLKFALEAGDFLVVGVNPDQTPGVTIPAALRLESVKVISLVNYAFLLRETPEQFVAALQPDVVVKGKEYEYRANKEKEILDAYGGKLVFGSGEVRFSSIDLLQREYFELNYSSIHKPRDYPARHGFSIRGLQSIIEKFSSLRVLVVGDLIVDEYINCDPLGMSQEDPSIVLAPIESKSFIGGAGIVAASARGLGAQVTFITIAGKDEYADQARGYLKKYDVIAEIFPDETRPTTRKQRFRSHNKTLLRLNHLRQHAIGPELVQRIGDRVVEHLKNADLLLFSDFNYGCLPQPLVDRLCVEGKRHGVMMCADSQASSQFADISRFKGMTLITPTEREARLALRNFEAGLVIIGQQLQESAHATNVIITLGSEGILLRAPKDGDHLTDQLPAFNSSPKDVAGAGDSFFTSSSMALRVGASIWESAYLGALAASCQVSRVGNIPLSSEELIAEILHDSD